MDPPSARILLGWPQASRLTAEAEGNSLGGVCCATSVLQGINEVRVQDIVVPGAGEDGPDGGSTLFCSHNQRKFFYFGLETE